MAYWLIQHNDIPGKFFVRMNDSGVFEWTDVRDRECARAFTARIYHCSRSQVMELIKRYHIPGHPFYPNRR